MKVLHIIARLDVGGSERVAINIASGKAHGTEYHVAEVLRCNTTFTASIISELHQKGIHCHRAWIPVLFHWHYLCEKALAFLFAIRLLVLWIRLRPDVIHCHTEIPEMAVWATFRLFPFVKCKVVRTIHNTVLWTGMPVLGPRVERFMQQQHANVAISDNVADAYASVYGYRPPIIYNGLQVPELSTQTATTGHSPLRIMFAGRFEEQKGISTLCAIIRRLADDPRYLFHIYGSGSLQHLVDELRPLPSVEIFPPRHNIASVMSQYDYIIMPSLHEGLSILAIEASMNAVPLLINHCRGLYDTLPPQWPLTVHDNDLDQWMHLMRDILPTSDCDGLGLQARRYAIEHFAIETMQQQYEHFYRNETTTSHT